MDIDKVFPGATIKRRELRYLILSYKRYGKLKDIEKNLFQKIISSRSKYNNSQVWSLALCIRFKLGEVLSVKHFRVAYKWYSKGHYHKLLSDFYTKNPNYRVKSLKAVYKEFIFQGFVRLEDYTTRDLRNKRVFTRYDYIMSNIDILGTRFIYPIRLSSNYKILYKRGIRNPKIFNGMDYFNRFGVPGYTCYRYASYN